MCERGLYNPISVCPDGFAQYEDNCYMINNTLQDYNTSDEWCRNAGGHLATADSPEINQFLASLGTR